MNISFQKNGAVLSQALCSILFCLYSFVFTCFYQANELALMIRRLTDGIQLYLNRWVVGLLLTGLLLLLQRGLLRLMGGSGHRLYVLSFVPSFLVLMFLSSFTGIAPFAAFLPKLGTSLVLVVLAVGLFVWRQRRNVDTETEYNPMFFLPQSVWFMALLMFAAAYGGAVPAKLHQQLVMEMLIKSGNSEKALEVGKRDTDADSALTSLRVLALANEGLLGEQLFDFPLRGKSAAMMPNGKSVRWFTLNAKTLDTLFVVPTPHDEYITLNGLEKWAEEHKLTKPAYDYLLCGYLLDRRTDLFAINVFRYYPNNNELPKHYREALTLYMHQRTNPVVVYSNNLMETDYQDFQDLENKYKNRAERINALRSVYGNTYWFYYNYGE